MKNTYNCSVWQSPTGDWHAGDVSDLANGSNFWWIPARLLNISLEEYINILVKTFKVTYLKYNIDSDVLFFSWDNELNCKKYKNWINKSIKG